MFACVSFPWFVPRLIYIYVEYCRFLHRYIGTR